MATPNEWFARRAAELGRLGSYFSPPVALPQLQKERSVFDFWPAGAGERRVNQQAPVWGSWVGSQPPTRGSWFGSQPPTRGSWFGSQLSPQQQQQQRSTTTAISFFSGIFSYLFYLSIISFFIFMLLVVVHYTITPIFKFDSSGASAPIDVSSGTTDGQLTWSSGPPPPDSSPSPGFSNLLNADYTLSFDVFLSPEFSMIQTPRVLLYRSTSPKKLDANMDISTVLTRFTDSNIIVYIDPLKNDLCILTQTVTTTGQVTPEPLPTIVNVPVGSPFRVGIIFTSNYVEVYINGKMEATRVLKGTLISSLQGKFYSPPSMVSSIVKIANLQYWSRILTPSDLRGVGPVLPAASFFTH